MKNARSIRQNTD